MCDFIEFKTESTNYNSRFIGTKVPKILLITLQSTSERYTTSYDATIIFRSERTYEICLTSI